MNHLIKDVFTFAFRESGKWVLFFGGLMVIGMQLATFAPIFGLIAYLIILGYLMAVFWDLVLRSAGGSEECEGFPETHDFLSDIIAPAFKFLLIMLLSFAPCLVSIIFFGLPDFALTLLFIAGCIYFPMALLGVIVLGTFSAALPHIVIPSIVRAGGFYWLACALLYLNQKLIEWMNEAIDGALPFSIPIDFILLPVIGSFLFMYSLMTSARIIGLIYDRRQEELGWI